MRLSTLMNSPEYNKPQIWALFGLVVVTYRFVFAKTPFVKRLGARVDAATAAAHTKIDRRRNLTLSRD
ncbi:hypothetical protein U1839_18570 [Sphingomonas sp. RT2P30]|uniref:hypothetical protein n=1 Tax=Parasphingomonas halimpatiens TaxID=3096162 RepID=UPI002FC5C34B